MQLKEYLLINKINYSTFSKKIGVSSTYINYIANGVRIPSRFIAKKIEDATEGSVNKIELMFPETAFCE